MITPELRDKYQMVVGLEVHAQLLTNSKAYSTDSTEFGELPNTNVSAVTIAHPGTLPRVNERVVEMAVKMGLATHCQVTRQNLYARKNYFYPDLPKGYQITQDKTPICTKGRIDIKLADGSGKTIGITRIHMEEDAGKSMHLPGETESLVDLNRAGVPLIEIVSEPDIRSSEEAYAYLVEVKKLVRYLDICDGNMEEGSLRCDANISVMRKDALKYGTRVEVKNMNSFRNVQRAIEHEVERQILLIEQGGKVLPETRNFDAATGLTVAMRSKETLNDYRYFPEPDLVPLIISEEYLAGIQTAMPALPYQLFDKFTRSYGLTDYDAHILTDSKEAAMYFEKLCKYTQSYKAASNWMNGPVKSYLNELTLHMDQFPIAPATLAQVITLVDENRISFTSASKNLFPALIEHPEANPQQLAEQMNLIQDSDQDSLLPVIQEVLARYPEKVQEYRNGKTGLLGLFMGDVMKATKGKADPKLTNQLLQKELNK